MQRVLYPYRILIGDYVYVLFWGTLIGIVYIRTQSSMIASFVGLVIASMFVGTDTYISSQTSQVFSVGYLLVAVSIGLTMFFIVRHRAHNP